MMKVPDLIRYITWYATENDIALTTVRLVKFIYLSDIYFARMHEGNTLTHLPWIFLYYGPYCSEVIRELDEAVSLGYIDRKSFESRYEEGKEYYIYTCVDKTAQEIEEKMALEVLTPLKAAIKRYGDDTALLLDHIYFETEPMIEANKGDILDFSLCKPVAPPKEIPIKEIPKEKIARARHHIRSLFIKFQQGQMNKDTENREVAKFRDDLYYQALEMMDEEDLKTGLEGIAKIVK
jgi:hypothetical protein